MSVPKEILDLVERFERQLDAYKFGQYNETQLRREFLDPFFKALGWDIDNEQGYAEAYKDVIHEDSIKVGEATKAPDYCFCIGGARKFFLEAKRPSVDIKHDVGPAFQLRRYGFTTKLPLNILSDFEEFAVHDCRFKPDQHDNAAAGRILYIPYTDYAKRWDEIAGIFSRDAVLKGAFDKYAESTKAKRGTADVDDEFLKTIEGWRANLARNLALRNPRLTQRELNFAVQRIIDRIIFLRICEGRGIEDYGRLQALTNGDRIYPRLAQQFEQADDRYNSGLFHFKREKDRHEAPANSPLASISTTSSFATFSKACTTPNRRTSFPRCRRTFSARSMSNFSAKSSGLRKVTRRRSKKSRKSRKPGAFITRPPTLSITSSGTPWANCWKTRWGARSSRSPPLASRRRLPRVSHRQTRKVRGETPRRARET